MTTTYTILEEIHNDSVTSPSETYYIETDDRSDLGRVTAGNECLQRAHDTVPAWPPIKDCALEQLCSFAWRVTVSFEGGREGQKLTPMTTELPGRPTAVDELEPEEDVARTKENVFAYRASPQFFDVAFSQKGDTFLDRDAQNANEGLGFTVGNLINVQPNGWGWDVRGMTLEVPPITDRISFPMKTANVNAAYRQSVRDLCGKLNNAGFNGARIGTMRLVEATSSILSNTETLVTFGFAYKPIITHTIHRKGVQNLSVTMNTGHDLVWTMIYPGRHVVVQGLPANPDIGFEEWPDITLNYPNPAGVVSGTVTKRGHIGALDIP